MYSDQSRVQREQMGIHAHDTRGVSTTWTSLAGVPFDILDGPASSHPRTFACFHLKNLPATKGRFSRAVLAAAGTAFI